MTLYLLDLLGVAVFAISGALAAGRAGLDLLGVIVLAALTAIGGGTLRDLLLNRHPIFWIRDPKYLGVIIASALLTVVYVRVMPVPGHALQVAEEARLSPIVVVLMGTMTGVGGGVVRDVLSGHVPMILRKDIYASAAIAGIVVYLLLQRLGAPKGVAFGMGLAVVAGVRLAAIAYGLQLPVFVLPA